MMIKKCDRCGCCYNHRNVLAKDGTIEKHYTNRHNISHYDLCPERIKEFERWIKK